MKKGIKIKIFSLLIGLITINTLIVYSSDDNHNYSLSVKSFGKNVRTTRRYRQTNSINNPWKVKLITSGEGSGTITTFWLEDFYAKNVSSDINAKQGAEAIYDKPYSSANKIDVYMAAENNNYNYQLFNK